LLSGDIALLYKDHFPRGIDFSRQFLKFRFIPICKDYASTSISQDSG